MTKPGPKAMPMIDRFIASFSVDEKTGYWLWHKAINDSGYALISVSHSVMIRAHRFSYEHFVGKIPEGLDIDHICRVRNCVNPKHLRPLTHRDNILCGKNVMATNSQKTHCPKGHPYNAENTAMRRLSGRNHPFRRCKVCDRERAAEKRSKLQLPAFIEALLGAA